MRLVLIGFLFLLSPLLFACQGDSTFSWQKPPPDKVLLRVDAPASGIAWRSKQINCQKKEDGLCQHLGILLDQLEFPPRSETVLKTLDDDYEDLQEKARFSKEIASSKGVTSLPPGRSDSYSFPVAGQELTAIISGSVDEVKTILYSPSGRAILPGSSLHQKTPYLERFLVANPEPGTWRMVSNNFSDSKPVYSLTYETFVSPFPAIDEALKISAEVLDDGQVVLSASDPLAEEGTVYEWDLGDGWAGRGPAVGHHFSPGTYLPELLTLRQGVGQTLTQAPFIIRKRKKQPADIIPVNKQKQTLPSPPKILRAAKEGDNLRVAALTGSGNGSRSVISYQYSLDGGGSWQDIFLLSGYFTLPLPETSARLQFRSLNARGASEPSITICNFSGFYPLEAEARGTVSGEKVDLEILAGGCPGERWNILAPLWKEAGIF